MVFKGSLQRSIKRLLIISLFFAINLIDSRATACGFKFPTKNAAAKGKKSENPSGIVIVGSEDLKFKIQKLSKALEANGHAVQIMDLEAVAQSPGDAQIIIATPEQLATLTSNITIKKLKTIAMLEKFNDSEAAKGNAGRIILSDFTLKQVGVIEEAAAETSKS